MENFDENFTKIDLKDAQIALKLPEKKVLPSKIPLETVLRPKTHEKSRKSSPRLQIDTQVRDDFL